MPYDNERENLLGHRGFTSDESIRARLRSVDIGPSVGTPSSEELGVSSLSEIDGVTEPPNQVVAIDGSRTETPIDAERINAQVGFVEVAVVTVDSALLRRYKNQGNQFVPPTVEGDSADAEYVRMLFPSQNAYFNGEAPKPVGFRRLLYENFRDETVRGRSLLEFLIELLDQQGDITDGNQLTLRNCPYRDHAGCGRLHQTPASGLGHCHKADLPLFPTDRLRIHEYVSNRSSNISAMTVAMKTVEHIALGLAIDDAVDSTESIETAFIKDGPLAQFDTAAWISRGMSNYLHELRSDGHIPIVVGVDKSGNFSRFAEQIRYNTSDGKSILEANSVVPMSSNFIYDRVDPDYSETMFGRKTYYGKSFLYKTPSNYMFCLTVGPREFKDGATNGIGADSDHDNLHYEPGKYPSLGPALATLLDSELALYEDSVIPIHMAHDRATIPQKVGDKVLSELVERELLGADRVYGR